MKSKLQVIAFILISLISAAQEQKMSAVELENWKKDLTYLRNELPGRHRNLYHSMDKVVFDSTFETLLWKLPALSRTDVLFELDKIITKIGDGHTGISGLLTDPKIGFTYLPLGIYTFSDGTYIYAAAKEYAELTGSKIIRIGETKIESVLSMLKEVIPHDNEMGILNKAGLFLATPEILKGLNIISNLDSVPFTVQVNDAIITRTVKRVKKERPTGDNWTLGWKFSKSEDWVDARKEQKALWLKDPQEYYWFEYLPEQRAIYFALQGNANKEKEPFSEFTRRVFHFLDSVKAKKMILDLRWNYGGNNQLNRSLIVSMIKSYTDQKGKSFTLINKHTFSAAQSLVNALEKYTNTVFIGEPTSSNVNFYADPSRITLPNSGISIAASSLWWQDMDPRDKRKWTSPQVAVSYTWQDFLTNQDPCLAEALAYKPQPNLYDQVLAKINAQDLTGAIVAYHQFKQDPRNVYLETESEINNLGYYLLEQKKFKEAIEILRLNTVTYPLSANAFDSLAEAFMMAGMNKLAIENYEKSVELNPSNYNAVELLKKLKINSSKEK